jgi:hypothetical protein
MGTGRALAVVAPVGAGGVKQYGALAGVEVTTHRSSSDRPPRGLVARPRRIEYNTV